MTTESDDVVQRVREAQARALELRGKLGQLALQLADAYREAARQNDRLATNRPPPTQADHRVAAKRWRALAETASSTGCTAEDTETARTRTHLCPSCSEPMPYEVLLELAVGAAAAAECPRCGAGAVLALLPAATGRATASADPVSDAIADEDLRIAHALNDVVVARLFAAELRINSALCLTRGKAHERLVEAIHEVDESIVAIRDVAFGLGGTRKPGR
ncbi:hypothetical protein LWC35_32775 [Pseudonocardia kujensis]|uniref:hypothetical protein n=1 Tax=Pseudonocardia kujensis TaxID=1128675 RepID=UPI001E3320C8|nr:hypothetical protein [Pseudonocardia kujensis]MCE0767635.1 hypothetical protein [Pseudonocardia kujensis]